MKIHLVVIQFQISILKLCVPRSSIFNKCVTLPSSSYPRIHCRTPGSHPGPVGTTVPRPKAEKHLQILVHSSVSWFFVMTPASWISGYDPIPYRIQIYYIYIYYIYIYPKFKGISPIILFWGWDFETISPTRNREGSGFLGIYDCISGALKYFVIFTHTCGKLSNLTIIFFKWLETN